MSSRARPHGFVNPISACYSESAACGRRPSSAGNYVAEPAFECAASIGVLPAETLRS
jgi:hypothetical protein